MAPADEAVQAAVSGARTCLIRQPRLGECTLASPVTFLMWQVMLCIDDSESMRSTGAGTLACEALALLCQALSRLEVGQLAVLSFAEAVRMVHPFDRPFSAEAGAHMLSRFSFKGQHTHMEELLRTVVRTLSLSRASLSASAAEQWQLAIIVSDGRRSPSWGDPQAWVRRAKQEHILLCFIVIDTAAENESILSMQTVSYPGGKLTISRCRDIPPRVVPLRYATSLRHVDTSRPSVRWMDSFPFPFYLLLRELSSLPAVLSDALRQWFELSSHGGA